MASSRSDDAVLKAIFNPNLPSGADFDTEEEENGSTNGYGCAKEQLKDLEIEGVKAAETGDYDASMAAFTQVIDMDPDYPSVYNNRAQLRRLKGDVEGAMADLTKALELSNGHGKVAAQAYTQRGLIQRLEGDDDRALDDFKKAACLGNAFAKSQVIKMNPYAALCNQMLTDVIGKLARGEVQ